MVDHNALKTNQAFIIGLLLLAFLTDSVILVAFVGLTMLLGSLTRRPGFILAFRALQRFELVQSDLVPDQPAPHRFAQTLGSLFLVAAVISLLLHWPLIGWALSWLVIALAALNLFVGFCLGCALYYWLNRIGAPGFNQDPPEDSKPGWRPDRSESSA